MSEIIKIVVVGDPEIITGSTGGGIVGHYISGATNGLTVSGKNIMLGGTLTGTTVINTANHLLNIGTSGSTINVPNARLQLSAAGGSTRSAILQSAFNSNTFSDFRFSSSSGNTFFTFQSVFNSGASQRIIQGHTSIPGISVTDTSGKGLFYANNYNSTFENRSLVDKCFVTGITSTLLATSLFNSYTGSTTIGAITGATNGLTVDVKKIKLGGPLTEYIYFTDSGNTSGINFQFGELNVNDSIYLGIDSSGGLQVGGYNSDSSTSGGLWISNNQGSLNSSSSSGQFNGGIGTNEGNVSLGATETSTNNQTQLILTTTQVGLFAQDDNSNFSDLKVKPVGIDLGGGISGITITGPTLNLNGNGALTPTELRFYEGSNEGARYVSLKANLLSATSHDYYLPTAFVNGYLYHNGSGQWSWEQFPIDDQILNGVADRAPSQNAVYRALTGLTETINDVVIRSVTGTTTLSADDKGKTIECNGTFTITLPNSVPLMQVTIVNVGSGTITIAATGTLQSKSSYNKLATQYGAATCYARSSTVWLAAGDLTA